MHLWVLHCGWTDGALHHKASSHGRFPPISFSVIFLPGLLVACLPWHNVGLPAHASVIFYTLTFCWLVHNPSC
ncbi:hypothetical protein NC651_021352 [Populus alba x Populus x berolinensis]|nr:hypothetical protein NC651_021352 [Populus alba x Populus x berolinensis]